MTTAVRAGLVLVLILAVAAWLLVMVHQGRQLVDRLVRRHRERRLMAAGHILLMYPHRDCSAFLCPACPTPPTHRRDAP